MAVPRVAMIAAVSLALFASAAANARSEVSPNRNPVQYRGGHAIHPRAGDGKAPGTDDERYRRPAALRARDRAAHRCDPGAGNTLLAAIAGGLLGNAAVGRTGSAFGAGAAGGRSLDRYCLNPQARRGTSAERNLPR